MMTTTYNCVVSSEKKKNQGTSSPSSTASTASTTTTTPVVNKKADDNCTAIDRQPIPSTTTTPSTPCPSTKRLGLISNRRSKKSGGIDTDDTENIEKAPPGLPDSFNISEPPSTPCPSTKRLGLISKLKMKSDTTIPTTPTSTARDDNDGDEDISESIQSYLGDCPFGQPAAAPPYDPDFDGDHDHDQEEGDRDEEVDELEWDDVFVPPSSSQDTPNGEFASSYSALGVRRIRDSAVAANIYKQTQIDLDNSVHIAARGGVPLRSQDANIIKKVPSNDRKAKKKQIEQVQMDATSSSLQDFPTGDLMGCHDSFVVDDSTYMNTNDDVAAAPPPSTPTRGGLVRRSSAPSTPTRGLVRKSSMKKNNNQRRASIQVTREFKIYLPMKDTPVMKRRSISFDRNVVIRPIAPATELTDKPEELWIQSEELKRMHQISMELIDRKFAAEEEAEYAKAAEEEAVEGYDGKNDDDCAPATATTTSNYENDDDEDVDSSETCIRGLEALMEADLKMERKYDAWDSVLNEQEMQRVHGEFDDLNIADVYRYSTAECSFEALERAKQDEDEVRLYLRGGDGRTGSK